MAPLVTVRNIDMILVVIGRAHCANLPLGITFKILARNYEAAALGARPMNALRGKTFRNIDLMLQYQYWISWCEPWINPFRAKPRSLWPMAIAAVGNCFSIRVMFDDHLFTCEPYHIKVPRPISISLG